LERLLEAPLDRAVVALFLHVDEVDHHQTRKVAQAQLAGNLIGCFEIGLDAVSSILCSRVALPELMSIDTSASV